MIAVDTNPLVRLLARGDEEQYEAARHLWESNEIYIPTIVLLECEWVLRFSYKQARAAIHEALERIAKSESVVLENREVVELAVDWFGEGFDFADALILATARSQEGFATFDKKLFRNAEGRVACRLIVPQRPM